MGRGLVGSADEMLLTAATLAFFMLLSVATACQSMSGLFMRFLIMEKKNLASCGDGSGMAALLGVEGWLDMMDGSCWARMRVVSGEWMARLVRGRERWAGRLNGRCGNVPDRGKGRKIEWTMW